MKSVPETFEEAAYAAAEHIDCVVPLFVNSNDLEIAHVKIMDDPESLNGWILLARDAIGYANHELRSPMTSATSWVPTLVGKQYDYGPNNILRFGITGLQVRTWDKIARIQNLEDRDDAPRNESLMDSVMDLVGYCIIAVMLLWDMFELPLEGDL